MQESIPVFPVTCLPERLYLSLLLGLLEILKAYVPGCTEVLILTVLTLYIGNSVIE
jgi:hypothetical protein